MSERGVSLTRWGVCVATDDACDPKANGRAGPGSSSSSHAGQRHTATGTVTFTASGTSLPDATSGAGGAEGSNAAVELGMGQAGREGMGAALLVAALAVL